MKKLFLILIAFALIFAFASCEEKEQATPDNSTTEQPDSPPLHVHTEVIDEAVGATCTEAGLTEGKHCSQCGEIIVAQEEVNPIGHTEHIIPAVDATCESGGLTEGKECSVCHVILIAQSETPVKEHTYDDEYDESCNKCGNIRDVACAHSEKAVIEGYAPTCTETGLSDGERCLICSEILVAQEIIDKVAHSWIYDNGFSPSCTEPGLGFGRVCTVCGKSDQREDPALGHRESQWWVTDVPATTTEEGAQHTFCTRCGVTLTSAAIPTKEPHSEGLAFIFLGDECHHDHEYDSDVMDLLLENGYYDLYDHYVSIGRGCWAVSLGSCTDKSVVIPDTYLGLPVTTIYSDGFKGSDIESIVFGANITEIPDHAFEWCSLQSIMIPDSIYYIGDYAFYGCNELREITLGMSVIEIGEGAFQDCPVESLTILNPDVYIGWNAVKFNCDISASYLSKIVFNGTYEEFLEKLGDENYFYDGVYFPPGMCVCEVVCNEDTNVFVFCN